MSHEDSLKIQAWDKLGNSSTQHLARNFDQPVKYSLAKACDSLYQSTYKGTYAVGFQGDSLRKWLVSVTTNPNIEMDTIRICFGIYTKDFISHYPIATNKEGRTTLFLQPYFHGRPAIYHNQEGNRGPDSLVDPFNLGSLYP
jgi:hypothetical protein